MDVASRGVHSGVLVAHAARHVPRTELGAQDDPDVIPYWNRNSRWTVFPQQHDFENLVSRQLVLPAALLIDGAELDEKQNSRRIRLVRSAGRLVLINGQEVRLPASPWVGDRRISDDASREG